jgi:uncharacterized protein (TIGR02171 family)
MPAKQTGTQKIRQGAVPVKNRLRLSCFRSMAWFFPAMISIVLYTACQKGDVLKPNEREHGSYPEMSYIPSEGRSFKMGSPAQTAKMDEKPEMDVCFSYDFFLDSCEVTEDQFDSVMGAVSGLENQMHLFGGRLPVRNVTWFDALLFCNARSRKAGLDTVYSYSSKDTLGAKTTSLNALSIHLDRFGFRLPTEAEWEFTAKGGSDFFFPWGGIKDSSAAEENAWFRQNADNTVHPVGSLRKNVFGLYDMAGNVMEWTDDIKGPFYRTTVIDFIGKGAPSGNDCIPLKGGSYCHDLSYLRSSCRSDVYPGTAYNATCYIGFRCALGAVASGHYVSDTPSTVNGHFPLTIAQNGSALATVRLKKAKISFVNNCGNSRFLCIINFGDIVPSVYQFNDFDDVAFPDISPDGKWVAFGTQGPGSIDSSCIIIRGIESSTAGMITRMPGTRCFAPKWWVDTATNDSFLCYTDATVCNNDPRWAATSTFLQKMTGGKPQGTPQAIVPQQGSFYGGISRDGNYLATGYPQLLMRNRSTGDVRRLFIAPWNGKGADDSSQVCNVSISPSSANPSRVLFLDFGSSQVSTLTGRKYRAHEYCFIAAFSQEVFRWFQSPSGELWDYPRWSNCEEWAVASGQTGNGQHPRLYLLNLGDSTCSKIVEGVDVLYPCLWFPSNKPVLTGDLALDSAGYYNTPVTTGYQSQLAQKLPLFWKSCDSIEVLFLGSSVMVYGVDPYLIKNYFSQNCAYAGCNISGTMTLTRNYALPHCPLLRAVVISLDAGWLAERDTSMFSFYFGPAKTLGFKYDKSHDFWRGGIPTGFVELVQIAPHPDNSPYADSLRGFFPAPAVNWGANPPFFHGLGRVDWDLADTVFQNNMNSLWATAKELSDKKIHLIIINFPVSPAYASQNYCSPWGPSKATGDAIIEMIKLATEEKQFIHFYDANKNGQHDYAPDEAIDENHLSEKGAVKLTGRVDSLLNQLLR